jgi:hypothetical protein
LFVLAAIRRIGGLLRIRRCGDDHGSPSIREYVPESITAMSDAGQNNGSGSHFDGANRAEDHQRGSRRNRPLAPEERGGDDPTSRVWMPKSGRGSFPNIESASRREMDHTIGHPIMVDEGERDDAG